jgi:hypothetical protein
LEKLAAMHSARRGRASRPIPERTWRRRNFARRHHPIRRIHAQTFRGRFRPELIDADVTLELRHDIIIVNFAEITRQMLRQTDVPSFSLLVKHFEIPFPARLAKNSDYVPIRFNGK